MSNPATFLELLFDDLAPNWIELRLIEDRKNGDCEKVWYSSPLDLVADFDRIVGHAEREGRAVFFGVLPRKSRASGDAANVAPGWVAWCDIDFKDVPEADARARLSDFPIPPSIVVHSGRGLHIYWLMREPGEGAELSGISQRIAHALGGDHCHDPARILRLPGSRNLKHLWASDQYTYDSTGPVTTVESLDPSRRYNLCDFDDLPEVPDSVTRTAVPRASAGIASSMPPSVTLLLSRPGRVLDLYNGRGKSAGDVSNSGYDLSFTMALIARGVRDPDILDAAVNARPRSDGKVRTPREVRRTVDAALARSPEPTPAPTDADAPPPVPADAPPPDDGPLPTLDRALDRLRNTTDPRKGGAEEVKRIEIELLDPDFIDACANLPDSGEAILAVSRLRAFPAFQRAAGRIEDAIRRRLNAIRKAQEKQREAEARAELRAERLAKRQRDAEQAVKEEWPITRRGPHPFIEAQIARSSNGTPRPTYANAFLIIRDDPRWGPRLKVNRLGDVVELDGRPIESEGLEVAEATLWLAQAYDVHVNADTTRAALYAVAESNAYHPVRDYLTSLPGHDGAQHIARIVPEVFGISARDPQYDLYQLYVRRMMISAVIRVLKPGEKVDTALILVGKQGAKKSSFFKALFGPGFFGDSPIPIGDKNAAIQLRSTWGYELAEMASMKGKSAEEIKQFLSQASDLFRHIYEKNARAWPRHSILVGSVNTPEFLTDETGSRRFWPVLLADDTILNLSLVRTLRDRLWAEALDAARRALSATSTPAPADRWWFEPDEDEARATDAERFAVRDVWDGYVETWIKEETVKGGGSNKFRFTTATVLAGAINMSKDRMTDRDRSRMNRILRRMGCKLTSMRDDGKVVDGWRPPAHLPTPSPPFGSGTFVPTDDHGVIY